MKQTKLKTRNSRDILIQLNVSYFMYLLHALCFIIYILLASLPPFFFAFVFHYIIRAHFVVSQAQENVVPGAISALQNFSIVRVDFGKRLSKRSCIKCLKCSTKLFSAECHTI